MKKCFIFLLSLCSLSPTLEASDPLLGLKKRLARQQTGARLRTPDAKKQNIRKLLPKSNQPPVGENQVPRNTHENVQSNPATHTTTLRKIDFSQDTPKRQSPEKKTPKDSPSSHGSKRKGDIISQNDQSAQKKHKKNPPKLNATGTDAPKDTTAHPQQNQALESKGAHQTLNQTTSIDNLEDLGLDEQEKQLRAMLAVVERKKTQAQREKLTSLYNKIESDFDPANMTHKQCHTEYVDTIKGYLSGADVALQNLAIESAMKMFSFLQAWLKVNGWHDNFEPYYMPYYNIEGQYAIIAKNIEQRKFKMSRELLGKTKKAHQELLKDPEALKKLISLKTPLEILRRDPAQYLQSVANKSNVLKQGHLVCLDVSEMQAIYYHLCHKIPYQKLNEDYGDIFTLLQQALRAKQQNEAELACEAEDSFSIQGIRRIDGVHPKDAWDQLMQKDLSIVVFDQPVLAMVCKFPESIVYMKKGPDLDFLLKCFSRLNMNEFKALKYHLTDNINPIFGYGQKLQIGLNDQLTARLGGHCQPSKEFDFFKFDQALRKFSNDHCYSKRIEACEIALSKKREQENVQRVSVLFEEINGVLNTLREALGQQEVAWEGVVAGSENSQFQTLQSDLKTLGDAIKKDRKARRTHMKPVISLRTKVATLKCLV